MWEEDDEHARLASDETLRSNARQQRHVFFFIEVGCGKIGGWNIAVGLLAAEGNLDIHHLAMILHNSLFLCFACCFLNVYEHVVALDMMYPSRKSTHIVRAKKVSHLLEQRVQGKVLLKVFDSVNDHNSMCFKFWFISFQKTVICHLSSGQLVGNASAIDVVAFCRHTAVGILLNEVAIAMVVDVGAFKARAVLVLLDGSAIALSVLIGSAEPIAIGKANRHFAIELAIAEAAVEDVAVLLAQYALAVLLVVLPKSGVAVTVAPIE